MSIDRTTSANSTVTCLYSAERLASVTAAPHSLQNFEFSGSSVPHDPHDSPVAVSPPRPSSSLGSTSVSFHRWSVVSVISRCHQRPAHFADFTVQANCNRQRGMTVVRWVSPPPQALPPGSLQITTCTRQNRCPRRTVSDIKYADRSTQDNDLKHFCHSAFEDESDQGARFACSGNCLGLQADRHCASPLAIRRRSTPGRPRPCRRGVSQRRATNAPSTHPGRTDRIKRNGRRLKHPIHRSRQFLQPARLGLLRAWVGSTRELKDHHSVVPRRNRAELQ